MNDAFSLWHFRRGLLRAMQEAGHEVYAILPEGPGIEDLRAMGAQVHTLPVNRFLSPLADLKYVRALIRILRAQRPDIIHTQTHKSNLFGAYAAKRAGVGRVVSLISGLGIVFTPGKAGGSLLLRAVMILMYRIAIRWIDGLWFQNPDDLDFFEANGIRCRHKSVVILGGGINPQEFHRGAVSPADVDALRRSLRIDHGTRCVLMVAARKIWSKGVGEFISLSSALRTSHPHAIFVLVAPDEPGNPDLVPDSYLSAHTGPNLRIISEFQYDIKRYFELADIVVLPSVYREGLPRSLLEAAAYGCPIVTYDSTGCREVVEEGVNGFKVAAKDQPSLNLRVASLLDDPSLARRMGDASRRLILEKFAEEIVCRRVMHEVYMVGQAAGSGR